MKLLAKTSWPPYAVGAGIGALSWFSFATAKKPLGITTAFETTASGLGQLAPGASGVNAYLAKTEDVPSIDWEYALVAGVLVGSALSARASSDLARNRLPLLWVKRFGPSRSVRYGGAFLGGALMMFGARMAKGCTSGHGLSGAMQLAASSWLFAPLMAVTGSLVARSLFGKRGRQ